MIIGEISVPNDAVVYQSPDVSLKIDQTNIANGTLFITER